MLEVFGYQRIIDHEGNKKVFESKESTFRVDFSQIPRVSDQRNDSYIGILKTYSELKDL